MALLTEIIAPYRVPFLNALSADPRIDLDVYFFAPTEDRRLWRVPTEGIRFRYEVLPAWDWGRDAHGGTRFFNPAVVNRVRKGRYDCLIVGGYHQPSAWLALAARARGTRLLLWSESTGADQRSRARASEWLKRVFVRRMDGFVAAGKRPREYLIELGADPDRVHTAPNAVDPVSIEEAVGRFRKEGDALKARMGLHGRVILSVGRLTGSKGGRDLIDAFAYVRARVPDARLVLVGEGPQRAEWEAAARSHGGAIRFAGFVGEDELAAYYAAADVFAFPTHSDPWGLVLNEAVAAGLPVVVSDAAGASADLVAPGENGFLHDPGDVQALAEGLVRILTDAPLGHSMSARSRALSARHTPQTMARGMAEAILATVTEGRSGAT